MTATEENDRFDSGPSSEWVLGWRPLIAAFVAMGVGWNFMNVVASLFLKPMQSELGWSRTELSFVPLAGIIVALLLPLTAQLVDRFGPRRIAIAGLVGIAFAFCVMAAIPHTKSIYFGAVLLLGLAGATCNSVVLARGITPWFNRNLGFAVGLMMTGASVSAAIIVPFLAYIIHDFGWRTGFLTLAVITVTTGLPVVTLWFREPQSLVTKATITSHRDPMSTIVRTAAFWQVLVASSVAALPIGGFLGHFIPMLTDKGLSPEKAAGFGSVFAVAIGVGRISTGLLLDRLYPPLVICLMLVLAASGAAILDVFGSSAGWAGLAAAIALIGLAQGAEGDYITFFCMRLFGLPNFARVIAIMAMAISLGMSLGGLLFAKIFDMSGSYAPAITASILLYATGGVIFACVRMRPLLVCPASAV